MTNADSKLRADLIAILSKNLKRSKFYKQDKEALTNHIMGMPVEQLRETAQRQGVIASVTSDEVKTHCQADFLK